MAKEHPHQAPSNNDVNITAIFMICLIALLVVWSTGVSVPQLWRDVTQSVGSDTTAVTPKDGAPLPL